MALRLPGHKTRIVCTIGPASESVAVMRRLMRHGLDVARINLAHGGAADHRRVIRRVKKAADALGRPVAVLADLPGPRIRVGKLRTDPLELVRDSTVTLTAGEDDGNERIPVTLATLTKVVGPGDRLYLNDGFIELRVEAVEDRDVRCRVVTGGMLFSHKGVNIPGAALGAEAFTESDRAGLRHVLAEGADAVSVSFVRDAGDVIRVRQYAESLGYEPFVIAKIERAAAVRNIQEILQAADGIMVARGDLGVEIPIESIAVTQKRLIRLANVSGKPVITATQMLDSMTHRTRPTRAEVTDVANAILDGTDCVMLSQESAIGAYPVEAVKMLARIARVTEPQRGARRVHDVLVRELPSGRAGVEDVISLDVFTTVDRLRPRFVAVPTQSGATARRVSRFRLATWIIAFSPDAQTCRRLCLSYGAYPVHVDPAGREWLEVIRGWFRERGFERGLLVLTQGPPSRVSGGTNQLAVIDLARPEAVGIGTGPVAAAGHEQGTG